VRRSKDRLVWDEALAVKLALGVRMRAGRSPAGVPASAGGLCDAFEARLPFTRLRIADDDDDVVTAKLAGVPQVHRRTAHRAAG
jgi:hypothetical protein